MTPEVDSLWSRRLDIGTSPYLRYARVRIVENDDGVISKGLVYFVCEGERPKGWLGIQPHATTVESFLAEYTPDQGALF